MEPKNSVFSLREILLLCKRGMLWLAVGALAGAVLGVCAAQALSKAPTYTASTVLQLVWNEETEEGRSHIHNGVPDHSSSLGIGEYLTNQGFVPPRENAYVTANTSTYSNTVTILSRAASQEDAVFVLKAAVEASEAFLREVQNDISRVQNTDPDITTAVLLHTKSKPVFALLGAGAGMVLVFLCLLVREVLRNTVQTAQDVEALCKVPPLADFSKQSAQGAAAEQQAFLAALLVQRLPHPGTLTLLCENCEREGLAFAQTLAQALEAQGHSACVLQTKLGQTALLHELQTPQADSAEPAAKRTAQDTALSEEAVETLLREGRKKCEVTLLLCAAARTANGVMCAAKTDGTLLLFAAACTTWEQANAAQNALQAMKDKLWGSVLLQSLPAKQRKK